MMEELGDWNTESIKGELMSQAEEYFTNEIRNKNHIDNASTWHKSLQRYSKYRVSNKILNLQSGPIADI